MSFRPADAPAPEPTGPSARGPSATEKLRQAQARFAKALFNKKQQAPKPKVATPVPEWESDEELNALFDAIDAGMFEEDIDVYYKYDDEEVNDQFGRLLSLDRMIQNLHRAGCVDENVHQRWLVEIEQARAALDDMARAREAQAEPLVLYQGVASSLEKGLSEYPAETSGLWDWLWGTNSRLAGAKTFDEIVRELGRQDDAMPTGVAALRFVGNMVTIGYMETISTYTAYAKMNDLELARRTISDRGLYITLAGGLAYLGYAMMARDYDAFEEEVATYANDYGMFGGWFWGRAANSRVALRARDQQFFERVLAHNPGTGGAAHRMLGRIDAGPFLLREIRKFLFNNVINTPQFREILYDHPYKAAAGCAYAFLLFVLSRMNVTARKEAAYRFLKTRRGRHEYLRKTFDKDLESIKRKVRRENGHIGANDPIYNPLNDFNQAFKVQIDRWNQGSVLPPRRQRIKRNDRSYNAFPFLKWYDDQVKEWKRLVKENIERAIDNYDPNDPNPEDSDPDTDDDERFNPQEDPPARGRGGGARGGARGGGARGRARGIRASVVEDVFSRLHLGS